MSKFTTGLPLRESERATQPTLQSAFKRFETKIARRRRKRGLHQAYLSRATPETICATNRMVGSE